MMPRPSLSQISRHSSFPSLHFSFSIPAVCSVQFAPSLLAQAERSQFFLPDEETLKDRIWFPLSGSCNLEQVFPLK